MPRRHPERMTTTTRVLRRAAAAAAPLALLLGPLTAAAPASAAPAKTDAPGRHATGTHATSTHATSTASTTATAACPVVDDRLHAAATRDIDLHRITPDPAWRTDCRRLYRADGRAPDVVFREGFHPRAPRTGQYDLEKYVLVNQPSPYVSTTYDHDFYKQWWGRGDHFNYYIDAPGGIDVNKTIGDTHKWAGQREVAFPGGVDRDFVVGACPVNKKTRTEVMDRCVDNPHYRPWRAE